MRLIRALHHIWLIRASRRDLQRANRLMRRAADRMEAAGLHPLSTASGVPA